jgi:hypothetical protein
MPQLINSLGQVISEASRSIHGQNPDVGNFLKAFIGGQLQKEDDTGTLTVDPMSGSIGVKNRKGFGVMVSPDGVSADFRFGGDRSTPGRSPEAALDEALGIEPEPMEPVVEDWQDLWLQRNPNYR